MDCLLCGSPVADDDDAYRYRAFKGAVSSSDEVTRCATAEHVACVEAGRPGPQVRITATGGDFTDTTVRVIQPDGSEIPLEHCVRAVTIRVEDGRFNIATVEFEGVEFNVLGVLSPDSEPITTNA